VRNPAAKQIETGNAATATVLARIEAGLIRHRHQVRAHAAL